MLMTYTNSPTDFSPNWDLSVCENDGTFTFWDKFLDAQALDYMTPTVEPYYTLHQKFMVNSEK